MLLVHQKKPHATIYEVSYGELGIASAQSKEVKETFPCLLLGKQHTPNVKHAKVLWRICQKLLNLIIYRKLDMLTHETGPNTREKATCLRKNWSLRLILYLKLSATKITLLSSRREAKTRIMWETLRHLNRHSKSTCSSRESDGRQSFITWEQQRCRVLDGTARSQH